MEFVHEVTAYLENKPGRLAKICSALAHEKINIRALSVMDTAEPERPAVRDRRPGADQEGADVAGDRVRAGRGPGGPDGQPPGTLATVLERLAEEHINIEYAYASTASDAGQAAGDFPHLEPEASAPGPQRTVVQRRRSLGGRRPFTRAERAGRGFRKGWLPRDRRHSPGHPFNSKGKRVTCGPKGRRLRRIAISPRPAAGPNALSGHDRGHSAMYSASPLLPDASQGLRESPGAERLD